MLLDKIQLEPGEEVLATARKHWFVIVAELLVVAIAAIIPLLLSAGLVSMLDIITNSTVEIALNGRLISFGVAAWLLLALMSGFTIWTHYYLDLWLITDRRIISVDQIHFFNRNVSIFRLERLQDIQYHINGLLPTFLNFGTISAQTAGHHDHNFRATSMPDPRGLQATIQSAMDKRLSKLHIDPFTRE